MKYAHFEALALGLGTLATVATVVIAGGVAAEAAEVAAQLLLILTLAAALHWGRNGGFLAALMSIAVYVAMRMPLLQAQGLTRPLVEMLATRMVSYALIGVVGGELASRTKYLFARMEDETLVDRMTGVYSARFAAAAIRSAVGQWERYTTAFSAVRIELGSSSFVNLKTTRYRQLMRALADHLRSDIRVADELAFVAPATFVVLLPGTSGVGANVVAERLSAGVIAECGCAPDAVGVSVRTADEGCDALLALATALDPVDATPAPEAAAVPLATGQEL